MSQNAGDRRVFPDTSVLYPVSLLDLLMRLAENRIHTLVLSDDLLDELERKWVHGRAEGKRVPSQRAATSALDGIRRTFADSFVPRERYLDRIADMPGNDEDDKPHLAAAEAGAATHILTRDNQGGFPADEVAKLGIRVQDPDEYLGELVDAFPADCRRIVEDGRTAPPPRPGPDHRSIDGPLAKRAAVAPLL